MDGSQKKGDNEIFCPSCGSVIAKSVRFCPNCGKSPESIGGNEPVESVTSLSEQREKREQRWLICLLLCLFLGAFGAHRFYTGKIGTAILMIVTIGGVGIWSIIDLITIAIGKFRDKNGNYITAS
ncbi:MAG: TM2 domain-containing protein [Treponema sp.]|jgi:TM2 domain-containing membrane protein YozV|nr:TM2 domain-containing protein [Treponema sp.]